MSNKESKTCIQMKNDTSEHWDTASQNGFIPLLGEPIFYRTNKENSYASFPMKIGMVCEQQKNFLFLGVIPQLIQKLQQKKILMDYLKIMQKYLLQKKTLTYFLFERRMNYV